MGINDDLAHIRDGIEAVKTGLAVHDSKTSQYVERIVEAQEHVAGAVMKVAESTTEMRLLVSEMRKQNGHGPKGITLDRKTLTWLIGVALAGAVALGGGQAIAERMILAAIGHPGPNSTQP